MHQNDRRYSGDIERLRSEARMARLDVPSVMQHTLEGITIESVLDVGTGSGIFAEAFAGTGLTVCGIDIREDMLQAAHQFVPSGEFRLGKQEAIPYPDLAFDLVFMGLVLHEADNLHIALSEAHRIVTLRTAILEWKYREEDFGPPLDHRMKPEMIIAVAEEVGFKTITQIELPHLVLYRLDL
ncbi:MAG: class I SAM-dependent methyltransferase [Anaerolineae bacterium]|nr:class I SAM-dependent methyltransferase [Anaerolineae bacterium]